MAFPRWRKPYQRHFSAGRTIAPPQTVLLDSFYLAETAKRPAHTTPANRPDRPISLSHSGVTSASTPSRWKRNPRPGGETGWFGGDGHGGTEQRDDCQTVGITVVEDLSPV